MCCPEYLLFAHYHNTKVASLMFQTKKSESTKHGKPKPPMNDSLWLGSLGSLKFGIAMFCWLRQNRLDLECYNRNNPLALVFVGYKTLGLKPLGFVWSNKTLGQGVWSLIIIRMNSFRLPCFISILVFFLFCIRLVELVELGEFN